MSSPATDALARGLQRAWEALQKLEENERADALRALVALHNQAAARKLSAPREASR